MNVKRPMLWISASFVAGVFSLAVFGASYAIFIAFVVLSVLLTFALRSRRGRFALWSVLMAVIFFLGTVRYGIFDDITQKPLYPFVGKTGTVTGEVLEIDAETESFARYLLKAESFQTKEGRVHPVSGKMYVTVYQMDEEAPCVFAKRGDVISALCEISIPDGALNRGGFDYRQYLKTKSIFFLANANEISVLSHRERPLMNAYFTFRTKLLNLFDETFPKDEASILKAYILGDMKNADISVVESFSKSGLTHALAVSGMHVVVFLSILTAFFKLFRISKRKQLFLSVFMVVFFVIFTGASVSAIRAGIASVLAISAQLFYKRSDPLTALSEAAAVLCIFEPHVILNVSFELSFGATLGILLFSDRIKETLQHPIENLKEKRKRIWKFLTAIIEQIAVGLAAQVFVIPIMIFHFQTISLASVVATIVITPLLTPALAGGLLFCAVGFLGKAISLPFAGFVFFFAKAMLWVSNLFAAIPFANVSYGMVTPFLLLLYTLFILIITFSCFKRNRTGLIFSASSTLCLVLILLGHSFINRDVMQLSFINVGQGDCALIKAPNNCDILIDAGGKEGDCSVGTDTIKPYLLKNGVYDIEHAVISHGHIDHLGGMLTLMDVMEIKEFIVPEGFGRTIEAKKLLQKAQQKNIPVSFIMSRDTVEFQNGLILSCILPDDLTMRYIDSENENNHSAVLRFSYGNTAMLFTGDIEQEIGEYLAENYRDELCADILKVPHHGAKTSASAAFLAAVKPKYAVIPVGKNMYGHPHKETLDMLTNEQITTYRTDQNKDITFYINTERIKGIVADETGVLK